VTFFLTCPGNGVFLFFLYTSGWFFCHRFMSLDYDAGIYPQDRYACEVTMNKLDSLSPTLIYSENTLSHFDDVPVQRLIVLIPSDSDYTSATRRIADLARSSGAQVLFLGLCKDAGQELSLHRQLVTLSALLQDARVCAESRIEIGANWVELVKSNYRDGDMVICFAEQRAGLLQRPLSQMLQSNLQACIYVMSGLPPQPPLRSSWRSQMLTWIGSIGIILGLFVLQIQITSLLQGWMQTTLLILSVIAEVWLIEVWNSLVG
jgi:hypothetical protein